MIPSLKTCRARFSVEVAPTNADVLLYGVTSTLSGTPVKTSLPFIQRFPSFRTGLALINIECFHLFLTCKNNFCLLLLEVEVGKNDKDNGRELSAAGEEKMFIVVD